MTNVRDYTRDYQYIKPLRDEQMKTWVKRDGSLRVIVLYEAPVHVGSGESCLATVYFYTGSNSSPTGSMEREAVWDGTWDTSLDAILVNGDVGYVP